MKKILSTREKYDRMAKKYDLMELFPEFFLFRSFRKSLFSRIKGKTILEVGVGTGRNIQFYPQDAKITAIDFSDEMIKQARKRAEKLHSTVELSVMDVQSLKFKSHSFDAVIATFVFCSVPDPVKGLSEVKRVLKPHGKFYALEHVRPKGSLGTIFDRLAPLIEAKSGVHINRNTIENIKKAGFKIDLEKNLLLSIFKMIIAKPRPFKFWPFTLP